MFIIFIMEKPMNKWMIWGEVPPTIFGVPSIGPWEVITGIENQLTSTVSHYGSMGRTVYLPYIYLKNQPNVGIYTIHGSYGFGLVVWGPVVWGPVVWDSNRDIP